MVKFLSVSTLFNLISTRDIFFVYLENFKFKKILSELFVPRYTQFNINKLMK